MLVSFSLREINADRQADFSPRCGNQNTRTAQAGHPDLDLLVGHRSVGFLQKAL